MAIAAEPAIMPGCAGGLYLNTGTYATPVWTEQTLVRDVKLAYPWTFAKAQSRETPVDLYAKTKVDVPTQVVMRADPASTEYAAWVAAHWGRTDILDLLALNGKVSVVGAAGIRGPFLISLSEEPQEIEGIIYSTFELRATIDTLGNYPVSALVGITDDAAALEFSGIVY